MGVETAIGLSLAAASIGLGAAQASGAFQPDVPDAPKVPTTQDTAEAARKERQKRLQGFGTQQTILGGSVGAPIGQKTLLGS